MDWVLQEPFEGDKKYSDDQAYSAKFFSSKLPYLAENRIPIKTSLEQGEAPEN